MLSPANSTPNPTIPAGMNSALLSQLALDDEFRSLLKADPVAALAQHGINVERHELPSNIVLPEKSAFRLSSDEEEDDNSIWDTLIVWVGLI